MPPKNARRLATRRRLTGVCRREQADDRGPGGQQDREAPAAADAYEFNNTPSPPEPRRAKRQRLSVQAVAETFMQSVSGGEEADTDTESESSESESEREQEQRSTLVRSDSASSSCSSILAPRDSDDEDSEVDFPNHREIVEVIGDELDIEPFDGDVEDAEDIINGWLKYDRDPGPSQPAPDFNELPGLQVTVDPNTPRAFFAQMFDDTMFATMAEETNRFAQHKIATKRAGNF